MSVITGLARGRRLKTLTGTDVRPTSDKVKESMFNCLQFCIEGRRVLDLFAGSGQLGIEALSRGAVSAHFIDSSKASVAIVKDNLQAVGLSESAKVFCADAVSFLRQTGEEFDVAFLDPPYSTGLLQKTLNVLPEVMSDYGVIVCEHPVDDELPDEVGGFVKGKQHRFGKLAFTVYRKED